MSVISIGTIEAEKLASPKFRVIYHLKVHCGAIMHADID